MMNLKFKNAINNDSFVGLRFEKNEASIYLPLGISSKSYNDLKEREKRNKAITILKTISLAKNRADDYNKFGDNVGEENEIPFNAFIWIINDFLVNGVYLDAEKKYKQKVNNGKINWKKTIKSEHYINGENIVFINPYYEVTNKTSNIITELNAYCINKSIKYLDFLFGEIKRIECSLNDIDVENKKNYYISIINKELLITFNDRKKMLLSNMKRIISQSYKEDDYSQLNYGTYRYEYVWESLVKNVLGTKTIDLSLYFPKAYWYINGEEIPSSDLRPDSILKDEEKIYILDAKYYKYGVTGLKKDLPNSSSIEKQITYGDYIANNEINGKINKKNNIYNAFVLPYNKNEDSEKRNIIYKGYAESSWKKFDGSNPYARVSLILIDTEYLIFGYYKGKTEEKDRLKELIEVSSLGKKRLNNR